jgi:hypothetical protein
MKQLLYAMIFTLSYITVMGQQKDSISCPEIKLDGPNNNSVAEGKDVRISVKSFKKDFMKTHNISYDWVTVNSLITSGKNKSTVYISTTALAGQQIKAVVLINGLNPGCPTTATMTIDVVEPTIIRTEQRIVGKRVN